MSQNKGFQANHHNTDDETRPTYDRKFFELPVTPSLTVYKTKQEHDALQLLLEHLENKNFYEPISRDFNFVERRSYHHVFYKNLNPLNANFTKWSNNIKQFVGNLPMNCLNVFDHFVGLVLKGLKIMGQ